MTLYSVEPVDVLLVTEGVKAVIDDIVHDLEVGISRTFFMVWQDEMYSLSCPTQRWCDSITTNELHRWKSHRG